jgi:Raf kinase inhibitor-like YbhB/YbcL family protein
MIIMKRTLSVILLTVAVFVIFIFLVWVYRLSLSLHQDQISRINTMLITSPSFENNGTIPKKFTCDGGGINPELNIQNVPDGAKSLALILHDPDAPVPGGFTHWVVWNIAATTTVIKQESVPPGASEGWNGAKRPGYTAPCPPLGHGVHHYHFYLYALDTTLDLASSTGKAELEAAMKGHTIGQAELVGLYERSN